MRPIEVLRENRNEIENIAWEHTASYTYDIVKSRWEIGSRRFFYDFLSAEKITTFQKSAGDTMRQREKEDFITDWIRITRIIRTKIRR